MSEILIDHVLLDRVTKAAKESLRLRCRLLRNVCLMPLNREPFYRYIVIGIRPKLMYCCEGV